MHESPDCAPDSRPPGRLGWSGSEVEAGPVESLGVSVRVRTRGGKTKQQGITTSFGHTKEIKAGAGVT